MTSRRASTRPSGHGWPLIKRLVTLGVFTAVVGFALIQLVPYGRDHTNPPVTAEPQWDSPRTRQLAAQTCFACHSNQVTWPWYANILPASWLVQWHVDQGRAALNFSEWTRPQRNAAKSARLYQSGEMPPSDFLLLHPEARLSAADKQALIDGLTAIFGTSREDETGTDTYALMMQVARIARGG